jgi:glycine/D-amino acid oxidase-like deaminating enzyme
MRRVVICGGGVLGACLAYFLSLHRRVEVTVVERTGVACAASGKAGGFLALDWCDGSPLGPLARRGFALHAELAARFAGAWGYRRLATWSAVASARRPLAGRSTPAQLARRARAAAPPARHGRDDGAGSSRPVHRGGDGRRGRPRRAPSAGPGHRRRAHAGRRGGHGCDRRCGEEMIAAEAVVIALGPWSALACRWLPLPLVHGLKGNSIVLASGGATLPHALFVELEDEAGGRQAPELFPRPDGTTYVCGLSSEQPLPDDPAAVAPDPGASEALRALTRLLAPALADAPVLAAQACHRPVTRDGLPLLGRVAGVAGAYAATGHGPWGILNAPASGAAMAELILEGRARTVDLSPFDPARLRPSREQHRPAGLATPTRG